MQGLPEKLADAGWNVHVISSPVEPARRLSKRLSGHVAFHALPMERQPHPMKDLRALIDWIALLRKLRPDVVMAGTPKAGLLGMVAARLTGVKVRIYQVRGLRLETTTGWFRKILWVMERLTTACATRIVAVSPSLRDELYSLRLARPGSVDVIGAGSSNGVDTERFKPGEGDPELARSLGVDLDRPIIGYVGRLTPDKGVDVLSEASAELIAEGVDHQLLLVGSTEDDELVRALQANPAVLLAPQTSQVEDVYRLMDVFCLPTLREGFPNVVLEAAASGVPVVTTTATGAVDSVEDGVTGILVAPNSASDLKTALRDVIMSKDLASHLAKQALQHIHLNFGRKAVQENTVAYLVSQA